MSRVVWKELFGRLREQTKARLRHDILRSDRIYGAARPICWALCHCR